MSITQLLSSVLGVAVSPSVITHGAMAMEEDRPLDEGAELPSGVFLAEELGPLSVVELADNARDQLLHFRQNHDDIEVRHASPVDAFAGRAWLLRGDGQLRLLASGLEMSRVLMIAGLDEPTMDQLVTVNARQVPSPLTMSSYGFSIVPLFPASLPFRVATMNIAWMVEDIVFASLMISQRDREATALDTVLGVEVGALCLREPQTKVQTNYRKEVLFGGHEGRVAAGRTGDYVWLFGAAHVAGQQVTVEVWRGSASPTGVFRRAPSPWQQCSPLLAHVFAPPQPDGRINIPAGRDTSHPA